MSAFAVRPGSPPVGWRGSLRSIWLIVTLTLLAFQALVVQVHVHSAPAAVSTSVQAGQSAQASPQSAHALAPCALCEEMALSGHYMPPAPFALALAPLILIWHRSARLPIRMPRSASHRWRSRAPPLALQA